MGDSYYNILVLKALKAVNKMVTNFECRSCIITVKVVQQVSQSFSVSVKCDLPVINFTNILQAAFHPFPFANKMQTKSVQVQKILYNTFLQKTCM